MDAIPYHRDPRGRVYPLSSLLAIHVLSGIGDGNSPEGAADFARDPAAWLRDRDTNLLAELLPLMVWLARRLEAACATDAEPPRPVVGQTAVPDKGNELMAIRQLLPELELEGRVVSIDALACQTDIAQTIVKGNGWYLLAVKDNQSVQRDFACPDHTGTVAHDWSETVEWGH